MERAIIPTFIQATTYFKNRGKMLNGDDVSALKFVLETELESNHDDFQLITTVGNHKIYYDEKTGKYFTILEPISQQNTKEAFTDVVFQLKNTVNSITSLQGKDICIYAPVCSGSVDKLGHWVNCFATFKSNESNANVVVEVDNSTRQKHPETGKIRQTDCWSCGIHTMEAIYDRVYNNFSYVSEKSVDFNITEIEQRINNKFNELLKNGLITEVGREVLIQNSTNVSSLESFLDSILELESREIIASENKIAGYLTRINELSQEYLKEQKTNRDRTIQEINTSLQKTEETEYLKNFNNYCEFLEKEQQKLLRDVLQDEEENIKKFNKFFKDELDKEKIDYNDSVLNFIDNFLKEQTQEDHRREKETQKKIKTQQKSKLQPTPKQITKPKSLVPQQPLTQKNQTKIEQANPKMIFNDNCEFLEKEQAYTLRDLLQGKEENIKQFNEFFKNFREGGKLTLSAYIEEFIADFLKKQEQKTEEKNTNQESCLGKDLQTLSKNLDSATKEVNNSSKCCLLI